MADLELRVIIGRLKPTTSHGDEDHRAQCLYWDTALRLFSQKNLCRSIIVEHDPHVPDGIAAQVIPFRGDVSSIKAVATRCSSYGISVSLVEREFHPWAKRTLEDENFSSNNQPHTPHVDVTFHGTLSQAAAHGARRISRGVLRRR